MADFLAPLERLLWCGDPWNGSWPNYRQLGIGFDHVDELIRIATDGALATAAFDSTEAWAPLHAWRALGQLRAGPAVEPLLDLLTDCAGRDDDWGLEELPVVFGMIGPAALPALADYLSDASRPLHARIAVTTALECMAHEHPPARPRCIELLTGLLRVMDWIDPALNGYLASALLDLEAWEPALMLEEAFAGN
ncbi:MAG TPA: hypothetical protein VGY53_01110 [Isosphaeraceae bacterium]|nr:hypothetical protein [Isosphaeraceae bacterium]